MAGVAWPWLASAASGVLLALCYRPVAWGALSWVALVPLFAALWFSRGAVRREWLRCFGLGYVAGLVFFVASLAWLRTVTVPGWLLLAGYLGLYWGAWGVFAGLVAKPLARADRPVWLGPWSNLRAAALAACGWVVLEWLRGWAFTGFGWNALGVALVGNLPMLQIADLFGVAGISFLLALVNGVAALTLMRLRIEIPAGRMRPHYDFGLTVVLVVLVFSYGVRRMLAPREAAIEVSFAAVQANIPISVKRDPANDERILAVHEELSESAMAMRPDILVWPEAATPQPLFSDQRVHALVSDLAARHAGDFLLGTVHYDDTGDYNSSVLLTQRGSRAQISHKTHLVPFGEYVPLRQAFPLFAWVVGDLVPDDFDFGPGPVVLEMSAKPVRLGALICFEDTLAYITRRMAIDGSQLLVTLTNDAWFLRTSASEQHRDNAVLRTIETRLPLLRVANTGVTCAIDTLGRETHRLREADGNTFFDGVLFGTVAVPVQPATTLYTRIGDLFVALCAVLAAGAALLRFIPRR